MQDTKDQLVWLCELDVTSHELTNAGCVGGVLYAAVVADCQLEAKKIALKYLNDYEFQVKQIGEIIEYSREEAINRIGGDWEHLERDIFGPENTFEVWFGEVYGYESS